MDSTTTPAPRQKPLCPPSPSQQASKPATSSIEFLTQCILSKRRRKAPPVWRETRPTAAAYIPVMSQGQTQRPKRETPTATTQTPNLPQNGLAALSSSLSLREFWHPLQA